MDPHMLVLMLWVYEMFPDACLKCKDSIIIIHNSMRIFFKHEHKASMVNKSSSLEETQKLIIALLATMSSSADAMKAIQPQIATFVSILHTYMCYALSVISEGYQQSAPQTTYLYLAYYISPR